MATGRDRFYFPPPLTSDDGSMQEKVDAITNELAKQQELDATTAAAAQAAADAAAAQAAADAADAKADGALDQANAAASAAGDAISLANTAQNAVTNLAALVAASKVTQAWVGNATDMASVPRGLLIPQPTGTDSTSLGSHNHSMPSTGSNTGNTSLGSHNHGVNLALPTFKPSATKISSNGTIYYTPIISDREGDLDKLRFITGAEGFSLGFDVIDGYYLALMIYNIPAGKFQTIWNPGNIKNSITDDRSEVSISMGLTGAAAAIQPEQILVVAHQQIAPGLAQSTRTVAWVPQGGIGRTNDVLLRGCFYRTSGDVAPGIPSEVNVSSLVTVNSGIPWYAVSVNS